MAMASFTCQKKINFILFQKLLGYFIFIKDTLLVSKNIMIFSNIRAAPFNVYNF